MALHDDLLSLARCLVDGNLASPVEANLRRGVSTAYYALFHLLIHAATTQVAALAALRPRMARAFEHKVMKSVCQEYQKLLPNAAGQLFTATGQRVPPPLRDVAVAFVILQEARHEADYNTAITIAQGDADTDLMRAEAAFIDWQAVQVDPATATFLAELLCRSISRR